MTSPQFTKICLLHFLNYVQSIPKTLCTNATSKVPCLLVHYTFGDICIFVQNMTITFTLIQTAFFIYFYAHWNLQFCTLCIFHYLTVRDMTLHDFIMSMHQIAHFHTTKLLNTNNLQTGFQNGLGITCQPADGRLKHQVTPTVLSRAFDVSTMVCILCKKKASEDGVSWYPPKLGPKTPSVETVWDGYQLFFSLLEMELLPPPPFWDTCMESLYTNRCLDLFDLHKLHVSLSFQRQRT